jgi:hypothetical protein
MVLPIFPDFRKRIVSPEHVPRDPSPRAADGAGTDPAGFGPLKPTEANRNLGSEVERAPMLLTETADSTAMRGMIPALA